MGGYARPVEAPASADSAPSRETRRERAQRTREELLQAATTVFARRGYSGATYREIAELAGYSRGLVHFHFQSKHQLGVEVTRWAFQRWADRVAGVLHRPEGPPMLERLLDAHEQLVREDQPLVSLALQLLFDPSDEARRIRRILRMLDLGTSGEAIAAEFLEAGPDPGPETAERGLWLLAALRGLEHRAALGCPEDELHRTYAGLRRDLRRLIAFDAREREAEGPR